MTLITQLLSQLLNLPAVVDLILLGLCIGYEFVNSSLLEDQEVDKSLINIAITLSVLVGLLTTPLKGMTPLSLTIAGFICYRLGRSSLIDLGISVLAWHFLFTTSSVAMLSGFSLAMYLKRKLKVSTNKPLTSSNNVWWCFTSWIMAGTSCISTSLIGAGKILDISIEISNIIWSAKGVASGKAMLTGSIPQLTWIGAAIVLIAICLSVNYTKKHSSLAQENIIQFFIVLCSTCLVIINGELFLLIGWTIAILLMKTERLVFIGALI